MLYLAIYIYNLEKAALLFACLYGCSFSFRCLECWNLQCAYNPICVYIYHCKAQLRAMQCYVLLLNCYITMYPIPMSREMADARNFFIYIIILVILYLSNMLSLYCILSMGQITVNTDPVCRTVSAGRYHPML